MMEKIALITLYGEVNFGNKLQNYATQKVLNDLGCDCETLAFKNRFSLLSCTKKHIKFFLARFFHWRIQERRELTFKKFSKKYLKVKDFYNKYPKQKLLKKYDFFLVGSDQVWNPCNSLLKFTYDIMFLTFVPRDRKASFASSFSVDEIPDEWKERFKDGLNGFKALSVREEKGREIIKDLTGRESKCLLDPTMMLDSNDWLEIANKEIVPEKKYAFVYSLGEKPDIKKEFGLSEDLVLFDVMSKSDNSYFKYGPSEFISLISKAECVCTDSFHACVFSILFDKPLYVFDRKDKYKNMNSRMITLFSMFGIDYGTIDKTKPIIIDKKVKEDVLSKKRKEALEFLKEQFKCEENENE